MDEKYFSQLLHNVLNMRNMMNCTAKFTHYPHVQIKLEFTYEKYTVTFHICENSYHIITFQFNLTIFH